MIFLCLFVAAVICWAIDIIPGLAEVPKRLLQCFVLIVAAGLIAQRMGLI
jgi:hypothetical protein